MTALETVCAIELKGITKRFGKVVANDSIAEGVETGDVNNGVVLLPERVVFTAENMDQYDF